MISGYLARRTWLHRLPARLKLILLAALSIAVMPVEDWRVLLAAVVGAGAIYASFGRDGLARLRVLRPLVPILVIIGVLQFIAGGWETSAVVVARILVMVMAADLVTLSTTMTAMMDAVMPLLRPLGRFGVSPKKLSLAVALVLRFVPVLLETWRAREEAWRARSGRRVPVSLVAVFLADVLKLADHVAEALDARGFDSASPPSK